MRNFIKSPKMVVLIIMLLVIGSSLIAQAGSTAGGNGGLKAALATILGFFKSGYMKAILSIALAGLAMGLIANRGEPGTMKKFIPWVAACIILLSLSSITGVLFKSTGSDIDATTTELTF